MGGGGGGGGGILESPVCLSFCPSACVSGLCLEGIFRTSEPLGTKLGVMVHHCEPECHANNWDAIFEAKI